jgi:hypothetical protein
MKNFIKIVILFISLSTFSQSPWTKEKGKFYTQLSFTTIPNYDTLFGDPEYNTERETADNTIQFYGEYGITNSTSLLVNLPFKLIKTGDFVNPNLSQVSKTIEASKSALGNIEIGLKHNFYKKDWILSGQFSVEANTGSYNEDSGIRTGYDAWSFTPLFLAGKSFGKSYLQTFIGANIRTNDYSSNFKIGGELGRKITKNIWLIGFLDIVKSFENGTIILPTSNLLTGLYVNNQEYGSFGAKFIGEFSENFGITGGFGGAFFGKNVAKQAALTFGLYHKF